MGLVVGTFKKMLHGLMKHNCIKKTAYIMLEILKQATAKKEQLFFGDAMKHYWKLKNSTI